MGDKGKIFFGLILFAVLATFPIWFTVAGGKPGPKPVPELPANEKRCVESKEYMKDWHMDLLNRWRDAVVRDGQQLYTSSDGRSFEMSFTNTCMRCHASKTKFCDKCHNYANVSPYCWDCHNEPKGE